MVLMSGVSDAEKLGQLIPLSLGGGVVCFSFLSCLGYHLKVHDSSEMSFLNCAFLLIHSCKKQRIMASKVHLTMTNSESQ